MSEIELTFSDGKKRNFNRGIKLSQVIESTFPDISPHAVAGILDGDVVDLSQEIEGDASIRVLTCNEPDGLQVFWHSASHVMAQAVKILKPDTMLGIGPSISNGFYYDFRMDDVFTDADIHTIEECMRKIVDANYPFVKRVLSKEQAMKLFKKRGEDFKLELINEIPDDEVTVYENHDFVDLCRGPHVPSTGYIKNFKLLSLAGAYWKGDERNAVMQRIYGVAYPDKKHLDEFIRIREEARKRDHRRLGKDLDLFSFHPEGPGFAFWHHNGMVIYNEIQRYMHQVLTLRGYEEVKTPLILNEELWHRSGHWDNYKENMYFTNIDEQAFAVKPMNCPGGLLVYKSRPHSYRDLPLKLSEMGLVHRHEKSGVLHGLFRVRQFTQDDAHVFCTPEQLEDEVGKLIDLVDEVYHTFGYDQFQVELSTRPKKSIGTADMWNKAEEALSHALKKKQKTYQVNQGEGAFYGPKIDYHIQDSLGRLWQCGTIQVDFSMPERFDLEYVGPDGEKHRPVMIHRAILGSVERFIGILIEHVGGAFPVWLAPIQCIVIPIGEKHHSYAGQVHDTLFKEGIRSSLDDRSEKVGYKIREAEVKKIPYMCIIGDKEIENKTVSIRKRKEGDLGEKNLKNFIGEIQDLIHRRVSH